MFNFLKPKTVELREYFINNWRVILPDNYKTIHKETAIQFHNPKGNRVIYAAPYMVQPKDQNFDLKKLDAEPVIETEGNYVHYKAVKWYKNYYLTCVLTCDVGDEKWAEETFESIVFIPNLN